MRYRPLASRCRRQLCFALAAAVAGGGGKAHASPPFTIASASDLQFALDDIIALFVAERGERPRVTYGASGDLTRQIERGAPFDLFFSADEAFVAHLYKAGRTMDAGRNYAIGKLVLFVRQGVRAPPSIDAESVAVWLRHADIKRIAIANPNHAPYGRAARAALQTIGVWHSTQAKMVLGESVSQAAQFALSGAVEAAFVGKALTSQANFTKRGRVFEVPGRWHPPIVQRMVRIKPLSGAPHAAATRFYEFAASAAGQAALTRHGFVLPDEK